MTTCPPGLRLRFAPAEIAQRPAVERGTMVNRIWGPPEEQLHERHDASDFELRTQDKIGDDDSDG